MRLIKLKVGMTASTGDYESARMDLEYDVSTSLEDAMEQARKDLEYCLNSIKNPVDNPKKDVLSRPQEEKPETKTEESTKVEIDSTVSKESGDDKKKEEKPERKLKKVKGKSKTQIKKETEEKPKKEEKPKTQEVSYLEAEEFEHFEELAGSKILENANKSDDADLRKRVDLMNDKEYEVYAWAIINDILSLLPDNRKITSVQRDLVFKTLEIGGAK